MTVIKMTDLDLSGKRVLIREDLNVPIKDGKVSSDARIRASLPTIEQALDSGAKVILMSHLARPLKRVLQKYVQDPLSMELLEERIHEGQSVLADLDGEQVKFSVTG